MVSNKESRVQKAAIASFALMCIVAVLAFAAPAFAFDDGAGNTLISEEDSSYSHKAIDGDIYWAGSSLNASDVRVGGDVIAAGSGIQLRSASVEGSVRAAAQSITLEDCDISRNVTVAGETITIAEGSSANAVYAAGANVTVSGQSKSLLVSGDTVVVNGRVSGDVHVQANKLIVSGDADIEGTLHANVTLEPDIAAQAKVGSVDVVRVEPEAGANGPFDVLGLLYWPLSSCLIAVIFALLMPRFISGGAGTLKARAIPTLASGLLFIVLAIPTLVLLGIALLTAPLMLAGIGALVAAFAVAVPIAGSMLGTLALPNMNRFGASAIGGAVFGIGVCIPYVKYAFYLAAVIVVFGCLVQCAWLNMKAVRTQ